MSDNDSLGAQSTELHGLILTSEFTDVQGRPLDSRTGVQRALDILRGVRSRKGSVYLVGNGGSSAVVSHILTDFINVAKLRATTLHEPSLLTCMTNDYGYENAYSRIVSSFAKADDALVAVSSSGRSENIRNAAASMKEIGGQVITLSGFDRNNPLRGLGDLNLWLDSRKYGLVEIGHLFLLHHLADRFGLEEKKNVGND